jgi:hypothetical protein
VLVHEVSGSQPPLFVRHSFTSATEGKSGKTELMHCDTRESALKYTKCSGAQRGAPHTHGNQKRTCAAASRVQAVRVGVAAAQRTDEHRSATASAGPQARGVASRARLAWGTGRTSASRACWCTSSESRSRRGSSDTAHRGTNVGAVSGWRKRRGRDLVDVLAARETRAGVAAAQMHHTCKRGSENKH